MILTSAIAFPSTKLLANAIHEETGLRLGFTCQPGKIRTLHLRYGNCSPVSVRDTEYNRPGAISFLSNKRRLSEHLAEAGFHTPQFVFSRVPENDEYPVLIRTTLSSFKGRGIRIARNAEEFREKWDEGISGICWCRFIKTSSEFRVHVVNPSNGSPMITKIMKKVLRDGGKENKLPIRTHSRYVFSRRFNPERKYPRMNKEILNAAETLPGRFYALDVGWSRRLSGTVFYEANTAFGLDTSSATGLAQFFAQEGVV
jgi:hypothetical protein